MSEDFEHEDLPQDLIAMATRRRAGMGAFESLHGPRTALLILNMQRAWLDDDAPFDHAGRARAILPRVNALAAAMRQAGAAVFWLLQTTGRPGTLEYWSTYFDNFVGPEKRPAAIAVLQADSERHALHPQADVQPDDTILPKYRFSAFARNPHDLDALLRERGVDTVVIAGTATNICCESTARDAMMRDFRVFMPHDAVTAPDRAAHLAGLHSLMQVFADVRPTRELLELLDL